MPPPAPPRPPLRPAVVRDLLRHGLRPLPGTSDERLRDQVRDLYLFEIRQLRQAVRRGAFPMTTYALRVAELRGRYALLSLPLDTWRVPGGTAPLG